MDLGQTHKLNNPPQITVIPAQNLGSLISSKVHDSDFEIIFSLRYFHKRNSSCLLYSFTVIVTSLCCTYYIRSKKGGLWSKISTSIADLVIMRVPSLPCVTTEKNLDVILKKFFDNVHSEQAVQHITGSKKYILRQVVEYYLAGNWLQCSIDLNVRS